MESASAQSAAASKPQPSPPMARPDADQPPKSMAEVAAAIAALPDKKDALREAFDRLAACSPFPLPFAWDDLDAHISSIQSSISLRYGQLQVLEASRPAPVLAPVPTGGGDDEKHEETSEEEEEEEEVEEEEEEEAEEEEEEEAEEEEEEKEEEAEEEVEEVVEEEEAEEEVEEVVEEEEEDELEVEEEEEEVEEVEVEEEVEEEDEVDADNVVNKEQKADEEMLEAEEEGVKEPKELVANDEADDKVHKAEKGEGEQEESDGETEAEEAGEAKEVLLKGVSPDLQGVDKNLVEACATMNTASLVNILFKNNTAWQKYPMAIRHAKDAAAFILDVVRRFLPNKKTKTNNVWENCVTLIRCVPLVEPELSVHTTEQAKQLAKDWKKMIDKGGSCGDLGYLASWAFLYFLISYNIVSEFDANEIIRLFGTVPFKYQRKNCIDLCNGLGLVSRISDLVDYLIGNGQQLSAIQMMRAFKLVDKYPPLSLLEAYVKKAKRTALELFSKNGSDKSLKLARSMEIDNLQVAHTMVKQQHADSSKSAILEEINNLLAEYGKSRNSINSSTASNKDSRQQQKNQPQKEEQKSKKRKKKQQQHEEQDRQVQGKQKKLEGNQEQPQEKRQQLPQHKPQESKDQQQHDNKGQQHHNAQAKKQKQQHQQIEPQQKRLQHLNQPRPCVTKLATPVSPSPRFVPPVVPSVAQINLIGHQPFAVTPGVSQPRFLGIQGGPLAANGVPPQYNPFLQDPSYLHPSFYPR